jgi:hypothetical protein
MKHKKDWKSEFQRVLNNQYSLRQAVTMSCSALIKIDPMVYGCLAIILSQTIASNL